MLDVKEDKKGGFPRTHQNALKIINQNCEKLNLHVTNIWRTLNADKHRYTWCRKKPEIQCRLDFFVISSELIWDINLADVVPGYKTDHSMILLKIALKVTSNLRGCPPEKNSYASCFQRNPHKLYINRMVIKCRIR